MTDKDVGELLQQRLAELEARYPDRSGVKAFGLDMVIALIIKLVELNAQLEYWQDHAAVEYYVPTWDLVEPAVKVAYRKDSRFNFDIPEESWK